MVHIRVIKLSNGHFTYELIDGQQRITLIADYLKGEFALPMKMVVKGCDVGGMKVNELRKTYPQIYDMIMDYRISCKWYENLTDQQTSLSFIKVLNNVNDMKPQEIRNAIWELTLHLFVTPLGLNHMSYLLVLLRRKERLL